VNHGSDGWLVDPHAERAGGYDDVHLVTQKIFQRLSPPAFGETGVVRRCAVPSPAEGACHGLGAASGGRVHEGHGIVSPKQLQQRSKPLFLGAHVDRAEPKIGTVERA
jgi:hypothetical protein